MELESRDGDHLRVKVDDDVIVFPRDAEGRWAVAEGTVAVQDLTREQYTGWLRHLADEQGRPTAGQLSLRNARDAANARQRLFRYSSKDSFSSAG